jgi:hypothetical protein
MSVNSGVIMSEVLNNFSTPGNMTSPGASAILFDTLPQDVNQAYRSFISA